MQEGYSDCGLFAIAFATALANGKQPGRCFFDQGIMRGHWCNVYRSRTWQNSLSKRQGVPQWTSRV